VTYTYDPHSGIARVREGTADEMGDADEYLRAAPKYVEAMFAGPKAALLPAVRPRTSTPLDQDQAIHRLR